jgi:hypothetical protein
MIEESEKIKEMVGLLIEAARPLKRGDILGHERIVGILGVEPHTLHWQGCVIKLKRHMERERGITLWPEHTVGYKLCTIQDQIEVGHERQIRARRQIKKGLRSIKALPSKGLTLHQQRLRAMYDEGLRKSHRELSSQIATRVALTTATPVLPRSKSVIAETQSA